MNTKIFILGAGKPHHGEKHSALDVIPDDSQALDWTKQVLAHLNLENNFVTGYQASEIQAAYPELNYHNNSDWETTKSGWSFLISMPSGNCDCLVLYSDVLHRTHNIDHMLDCDADVAVAIDTNWRNRFTDRSLSDQARCEKVCTKDSLVTLLGSNINIEIANAEFTGLAWFSSKSLEILKEIYNESSPDLNYLHNSSISDLVELLRKQGLNIKAVDVNGDWAELNEPADIARFAFGTKAQTLKRLRPMVSKSRIEDQFSFTVEEWNANSKLIMTELNQCFSDTKLVVRSSALTEDGFSSSNAGAHTSILNIDSANFHKLSNAINQVIASYSEASLVDEVLVQPMVSNVLASGVLFTRSLVSGAPYFVINYDDTSNSTDSITSGLSQDEKTFVVRRDADINKLSVPKCLEGLLPAVREIEGILNYNSLDIEFCVTAEHGIHILQVRPLVIDSAKVGVTDKDLFGLLHQAELQFETLQSPSPTIQGKRSIFGVMPDWNPAEIIGTKPRLLANSLYGELILDEIWATQRAEYGYRDVRPHSLLTNFAGHPYIDVRASFNSFIPKDLNNQLAKKLVEFCITWLEDHPEEHDKVEFNVIPSCYDLDFNRWTSRLESAGGFNVEEIQEIKDCLRSLTSNAMQRGDSDLQKVAILDNRFYELKESNISKLDKAFALLDDAKVFGTLPFAHLARSAFIAVSLLNSAVANSILSIKEREDFLNSIRTVSHDLTTDAVNCKKGKLDWKEFVERYGHLRPGTYDILSYSYKNDPERYLRPLLNQSSNYSQSSNSNAGKLWKSSKKGFFKALEKASLPSDAELVENFLRSSIEGREYAKFIFSRNLSFALDLLGEWAEEQGANHELLSHISIADIRDIKSGSVITSDVGKWLREKASLASSQHPLVEAIELPPLICNRDAFSFFEYPSTQPNFVGSSRVTARVINLDQEESIDCDLENAIVMIPQADPGYDWLFGRRIAGLITKFGGANSHMAIRAAEFELPAALGIGETRYRALAKSFELELDPANKIIRTLS